MFSSCMGYDNSVKKQNAKINKEISRSARDSEREVKILLLGTGESGKSTIVKQMKIIHGDGYSIAELNNFKPVIHKNLFTSMIQVIMATEKLNIQLHNQACAMEIMKYSSFLRPGSEISSDICKKMKLLCQDDGFKECLKHAPDYNLNDSALYYFQRIEEIFNHSYIPSEQDVLRSRVPTTGIVETCFKSENVTYKLFDVGGQRSERRKWLHCFDDVKAVLFVASLNEYNMTLTEDGTTNRMEESLNLFQAISYNKFFENTSIILFLNKLDLFTEKINNTTHHLRFFFPHYTGPDHDVSTALEFILDQFISHNAQKDKFVYSHFTTATDTSNIKIIFRVVLEAILRTILQAEEML